jgi:AcrR family transcriptional regulator
MAQLQAARRGGRDGARERVLAAAYELFSRQGTRNVGIDAIVARSGVAKMSLYRHFPTKQDLVAAFLARREEMWTLDWLKADVYRRASRPGERLLAIFDVFNDWFPTAAFDGCSFINVLLEYPSGHPTRGQAADYLSNIRSILKELARDAGIEDVTTFADTWHIMMKGSIVAACEGNHDAAREIKVAAGLYLDSCLPPARPR